MKKAFMAFLLLVASASVSQADEVCGKIETIKVGRLSVVLKTGAEIKLIRDFDSIASLTTALANDLTVCIVRNIPPTDSYVISISK